MASLTPRIICTYAVFFLLDGATVEADNLSSHPIRVAIERSHTNALFSDSRDSDHDYASLSGKIQHNEASSMAALNAKIGIQTGVGVNSLLPARITKLVSNSPLAKRGIKVGDRLIGERTSNGSNVFIIEHSGQGLRITISKAELQNYIDAKSQPDSKPGEELSDSRCPRQIRLEQAIRSSLAGYKGDRRLSAQVSQTQLKAQTRNVEQKLGMGRANSKGSDIGDLLVNHDLAIIIDRSGSMAARDCPGGLSRWQWCCGQASALAAAAARESSSITVMFFNNDLEVFEHVDPKVLPRLFENYTPSGGTLMAAPLMDVLGRYFSSRGKPLIVAVVSDGLPSDIYDLAAIVQDASDSLRYAGEVTVSFLLIGNQVDAPMFKAWLGERQDGSIKNGGLTDVVSFKNMAGEGLKEVLFKEIQEIRQATNRFKPSAATAFSAGKPQPLAAIAGVFQTTGSTSFSPGVHVTDSRQVPTQLGIQLNPFPYKWLRPSAQ
jgi:hypothetical protein